MSDLNLRGRLTPPYSTRALGGLCIGGALVYTLLVGVSLLSWVPEPDNGTPTELASSTESTSVPDGPIGQLEITVTTPDESYVQNLDCTGDADADAPGCAEIGEYEQEAQHASAGTPESPFAEVSDTATCTEKDYGPETAVIVGTWEGERIDTKVSRGDSCEEARWQRLRPITDQMG